MNPITKAVEKMAGYKHSAYTIFRDFVEMGAIAISNAVDYRNRDRREERYMHVVGQYTKEMAVMHSHLLGLTIEELEKQPRDVLGEACMELGAGNERAGQFFTPWSVCQIASELTTDETLAHTIKEKGYVTLHEPACGAGGMIIAQMGAFANWEINYQQHVHVNAWDIDPMCVHMTYLQLSLLHVPAEIVHGDTLNLKVYDTWHTPAHIMGGWDFKLAGSKFLDLLREELKPVEKKPIIDLFDGAKEVVKPVQKAEQKIDLKNDPKPQSDGQQLSLF